MSSDDLGDVLGPDEADLEARFRELEREEELARMRSGRPAGERPGEKDAARSSDTASRSSGGPPRGERPPRGEQSSDDDDLADLKAAVESDAPLERYVLALCPGCQAKNRVSLTKLRKGEPRCGRCKRDLSFSKL